ncbi:MAG: tetratricopeptide repeat protein [Desulfitobacteriaceae bacterium]
MQPIELDPEIIYVQKIYFFLFLTTLLSIVSVIVIWQFGWLPGFFLFGFGLLLAYLAMTRKKSFRPPKTKVTIQRMAKEISQDTYPLTVSRFASQLYYYLHEPLQAISILRKFLSSQDPLLCATLAEILLKEGMVIEASAILDSNPYSLIDPLLLASQGHIFRQTGKILEAINMYERSLRYAKKVGFPYNGANWLTQRLLTLGQKAIIHHTLADCYIKLNDLPTARRHYWAGNLRLLDITFWKLTNENHSIRQKTT